MYEIIVGRSDDERKKLGLKGTIFLGKHYVRMGAVTSLSNKIYLDVAKTHVVLVSGKRGYGKCLSGDTLIQLEDGSLERIDKLKNNIKSVYALNKKLKIIKANKTEFFEREIDEILQIKLRSGKEIKLTPEHPLLTIKGWKEAQSLHVGSRIATPRILPYFGNKNLEDYVIKLFAYLISECHTKEFGFSNSDECLTMDFEDSLNKLDNNIEFAKESSTKITTGMKTQYKNVSIKALIEKYNLSNNMSTQKDIPADVMKLPKEKLALFLNRLFSCDGSIYHTSQGCCEISYSSSFENMIRAVQNLILRFGILSILRRKAIENVDNKLYNFELVIVEENVLKFIEDIGFFGEKNKLEKSALKYYKSNTLSPTADTIPKEIWELYNPDNPAEICKEFSYAYSEKIIDKAMHFSTGQTLLQIAKVDQNNSMQLLVKSDIFWDEIISVELIEGKNRVYDLCVPELHNFVANDIIVHNSYSFGVIAEEISDLPKEIKEKIAVLMIDTMGIFWTMKFPNVKEEDLLDEWGLTKKSLDIDIYTPAGCFNEYKEKGIPADFSFTINPAELDAIDWCNSFEIKLTDPIGVAIESSLAELKKEKTNYSLDNIISYVESNKRVDEKTKLATINRLIAAKSWGIFSEESTQIKDIIKGGRVSVLDISAYKEWNVKALVSGIVCKKLMQERVVARKKEEMEDIKRGHSYFQTTVEGTGEELPMVWILIDEAHNMLPKDNKTAATDALVTILREGRQPGISLILATQQPGEIHKDVITQTDIVISHRLTAKRDLMALNSMMQSYLYGDMTKYFNMLPKLRGSAIILDDNSERIYPLQVRPKLSWHGGEAPTAIKSKGKSAVELGL